MWRLNLISISSEIEKIYDESYGFCLRNIWDNLAAHYRFKGCDIFKKENVVHRQKKFIELLGVYLNEGRAQLGKKGISQGLIVSPVLEQLKLIENNWSILVSERREDDLDNHGAWFYETCPVDIFWTFVGVTPTMIENIIDVSFGFSIAALWSNLENCFKRMIGCDTTTKEMVEYRKKIYFQIITKLLSENRLKLYKSNPEEILDIPVAEQIKLIGNYWPVYGLIGEENDLDDFGSWFFITCPVGFIWVCKDGSEIWT